MSHCAPLHTIPAVVPLIYELESDVLSGLGLYCLRSSMYTCMTESENMGKHDNRLMQDEGARSVTCRDTLFMGL